LCDGAGDCSAENSAGAKPPESPTNQSILAPP
jgi:hypothetical protein